jgi:hypothetical protein
VERITKHVDSFIATDDSGQEHMLDVYQKFNVTTDLDGVTAETTTIKYLLTSAGQTVSPISKGEYLVDQSGLRLHSTASNAL